MSGRLERGRWDGENLWTDVLEIQDLHLLMPLRNVCRLRMIYAKPEPRHLLPQLKKEEVHEDRHQDVEFVPSQE